MACIQDEDSRLFESKKSQTSHTRPIDNALALTLGTGQLSELLVVSL